MRFFCTRILKFTIISYFLLFAISQTKAITSNDSIKKTKLCKELAIKSAKMANKSFKLVKNTYFNKKNNSFFKEIDSAIYFTTQSISLLDSTILIANDSDIKAITLAKIARNYSIDAYRSLKTIQLNKDNTNNDFLLKKAIYYSQNSTVEAYHSSFFFIDKTPNKTKTEDSIASKSVDKVDTVVTKLDVDQALFTILKEDLNQKKIENSNEIIKLSEELFNTKDPAIQTKIKAQLKELEVQKANLDFKQDQAKQKLNAINSLIAERTKNHSSANYEEDSIKISGFTKPIITDEWNKQIKTNSEMPDMLIYQVQLGVFKSNVLEETFKGLTPIFTTISDKGVCYSIGLFEKLNDAKEAKSNIKEMGLTDAFIVAYYKKKKITLAEAATLEKK